MSIATIAAAIDAQLGGSFAPPYTKSDIQTRVATALFNSIGFYNTNWVAYTPTGTWTSNTVYTGFMRRVGDSLEAQVRIVLSGAPTAATLTVTLPSGLTIDSAKLVELVSARSNLGAGDAIVAAGGSSYAVVVGANIDAVSVKPRFLLNSATGIVTSSFSNILPTTFASGDSIDFWYRVPIVGWGI